MPVRFFPTPVVRTSNNEAVRQHKQYRTDTIQNDAGKNKKNNEENDEENNQSTSEKENSEKKKQYFREKNISRADRYRTKIGQKQNSFRM